MQNISSAILEETKLVVALLHRHDVELKNTRDLNARRRMHAAFVQM